MHYQQRLFKRHCKTSKTVFRRHFCPKVYCFYFVRPKVFLTIEYRFLIILIYDITNPNSKTENYTCIQTSIRDVNTNNASSGLRENVIRTNLVPKFGRKNMVPKCRIGGGTTGRTYCRGGICAKH